MTPAPPTRLLRFPRRGGRRRPAPSSSAARVLPVVSRPSVTTAADPPARRGPGSQGLVMTVSVDIAALAQALLAQTEPPPPGPARLPTSRRGR